MTFLRQHRFAFDDPLGAILAKNLENDRVVFLGISSPVDMGSGGCC